MAISKASGIIVPESIESMATAATAVVAQLHLH
jgi:hypothetical protein